MLSLATGLLLGLLLGMRHALEPDHLAAVSVLATHRGSRTPGAIVGAIWGVGHTIALVAVGCVLAAIDSRLPSRLADGFELLVAAMLLTLGSRAILRAALVRTAPGDGHQPAASPWHGLRQPMVVGLIHGLAGSGALTALVLASLPTPATRLLYIGLFGIGSVIGMAGLTGLAGWPLARLQTNPRFARGLSAATGAFSMILGACWGWAAFRGLIST